MHQSNNIIMPCTEALNNNDLCFISIVNTTCPVRVEEGLETSHKNLQAKITHLNLCSAEIHSKIFNTCKKTLLACQLVVTRIITLV